MRVEWHGQSAFTLEAPEAKVFIDPFGDMSPLAQARGMQFDYPPIEAEGVDLLLVTHEHIDHNGVEAVAGEPAVLRSTAGTLESPIGEVVGDRLRARRGGGHLARAEHDLRLQPRRHPCRPLRRLRPERACAPSSAPRSARSTWSSCRSGGGPTIGAAEAATIVGELAPALGRADALPDPAHLLPRDRGGVRRGDRAGRAPARAGLRDRRSAGRGAGRRRARGALAGRSAAQAARGPGRSTVRVVPRLDPQRLRRAGRAGARPSGAGRRGRRRRAGSAGRRGCRRSGRRRRRSRGRRPAPTGGRRCGPGC